MKVRVVWKTETDQADAPPVALVDIRSHLLWGLDDGPRGLEQSLAMLKLAAAHGTTDIVASPSANFEHACNPQIAAQRLEELRARNSGAIRIHSGCDLHVTYENIRDAMLHPQKYAINGLTHLILNFPDNVVPPVADEILARFRKQGVIPVIAQPERNPILQLSIERLKRWIAMGCVLQVTARSLSGHFGKNARRFAWELLREGWVYVIASDGRDALRHPARLDGAWRMLKQELGEDVAKKLLIDNPSLILQGRAQRKPTQPVNLLAKRAAAGDQPR